MNTTKTVPTVADVIKLLNEGGWRLMGGKIARSSFYHDEARTVPVKKNLFFRENWFTVTSARLDGDNIVVCLRRDFSDAQGVDEGLEISGLLNNPHISISDTNTTSRIELHADFTEHANKPKGGGTYEKRKSVLALAFEDAVQTITATVDDSLPPHDELPQPQEPEEERYCHCPCHDGFRGNEEVLPSGICRSCDDRNLETVTHEIAPPGIGLPLEELIRLHESCILFLKREIARRAREGNA